MSSYYKKSLLNELSKSDFLNKVKQDPIQAINDFKIKTPIEWDEWIYRIVVISLSLIVVLCIIYGYNITLENIGLEKEKRIEIPQMLVATGSAALGALTGLLVPSPKQTKG